MVGERIKYKVQCKKCGYKYSIEVLKPLSMERCPICGNTIPLDELMLNYNQGKKDK